MKSKLKLSLVSSAILVANLLFTGCSDKDDTVASTTISGKAIDGYISGGTVEYGTTTATTDGEGAWSMAIPNSAFGNTANVISVSGGTDTATGLAFDGELKTLVPENTTTTEVHISPLTTFVQEFVANNPGTTQSSATTTVATVLGIPAATVTSNPIATLSTSTDSQKAMKAILQVQKVAEVMKSAGVTNPIAEMAKVSIATPSKSIDTVIADTITAKVTDADKKTAVSIIANQIKAIDSTTLTSTTTLSSTSKAVEAITSVVETKLASGDTAGASNIAKVIAMTGLSKVADNIEAGKTITQAVAVINEYNSTKLSESYNSLATAVGTDNLATILEKVAKDGVTATIAISSSGVDVNTNVLSDLSSTENEIAQTDSKSSSAPEITLSSIKLGDDNNVSRITLRANTNEVNVSNDELNITNFFSIDFSDSNVSATFPEQTVTVTVTVTKNGTTDTLKLTAEGILLDDNGSTGLKTTLPIDSSVTIKDIDDAEYTLTLTKNIVNSDAIFNLSDVITNLGNAANRLSSGIEKMNTRFTNANGEIYTVNISISGLNFNEVRTDKVSFSTTVNVQ